MTKQPEMMNPAVSEGPQNPPAAPMDALSFLDGISEGDKTGKKEFPVVPDPDGSVAQMVALIIKLADAEDQLKTSKKQLTDYVAEHYFNVCQGQAEPPSSMKAVGEAGAAVLINFQQRMSKIKDAKQLAPLTPLFAAKGKTEKDFFRLSFDLKIDGDVIPPAAVAALVTELKALFAKHGASAALKLEKEFKPYPAFYTQRNILFTPQENMAIHRLAPVVAVVRTKNVK